MKYISNCKATQQRHGILLKGFPDEMKGNGLQWLFDVLRCYAWHVTMVEWIQDGVYHVWTEEGEFCLKQSSRSMEKTLFSLQAMQFLYAKGFRQQPQVVMSANHSMIITMSDAAGKPADWFAITWLPGKKSVFAALQHLQACSRALADFHRFAVGFQAPGSVLQYHMWPEILAKRQQQMEQFKELVTIGNDKTSQEQAQLQTVFQQYYPRALERGERALVLLQDNGYQNLADLEQEQGKFIHGDVAARNFIVHVMWEQKTSQGFLIDFDYARYDLQIIDLARFIERCLRMSNFHVPNLYEIIKIYQDGNPLNKQQRKVLAGQLLYPQKFWRLSQRWLTGGDATAVSLRGFGYIERSRQAEEVFLQAVERELLD